ncbi:PQQ-binding-like beta-propeller repeat protein [Novosphingobium silvae]
MIAKVGQLALKFRATAMLGAIALSLGTIACNRPAQPVEEALVANPDEWPSWGRTGSEAHYSPLDEIDTGNVANLKLAWHFDLDPGYSASTPLMAEGKVFLTSGHSHIRALDAQSGKLLWEYDGGTRERATSALHLTWGNKGIAYDGGHVFLVTTDGWVVSLDAKTGEEAWKTYDFPDNSPRNANGAPRVFGGKVITGFGGADISPARGFVSAYDAKTGKLAWRFYTTPGDPVTEANEKAEAVMRRTWPSGWTNPDGSRRGGGATAWNAFSYDPELRMVYLGLGNGFPYNQHKRSPGGGDNLFIASIVALDVDSGEYKWHYQVCPGEQWDCTATTDMTLATLEIGGKERRVLMQAPKNGFFYVLDRQTGRFISAEKIAKVTWADHIDRKTGRPVENPGVRYNGKPGLFELWPGPSGAHSWMPQAYSPLTGLVYIPVLENGALIGDGQKGGGEIMAGMGVTLLPEVELPGSHRSYLKAWNPVTQTEAWRADLPGNWPGGVMASAGGLVFQGQIDGRFVARDAKSGKELWSFKTESPIVGAPITYRFRGRQYVTVITGNGGNGAGINSPGLAAFRTDYRLPRRVLTFALGGKDVIPAYDMPTLAPPADPDFTPDLARAQAGAVLFGTRSCLVCHGWNAVGGGAAPDLRYSPTITDAATFRAIVKEGGLKMNGMPPFPALTDQELETMRFYLRARAKAAPAEQQALLERAKAAKASNAKPRDFAGRWNITIQSPVGPQKAVMDLRVAGNIVTGKVVAEQGSVNVAGAVKDGRARFQGKASMPMPITVSYDVTVRDGRLTGENANGPFGTFPVTGER